MVFPHKKKGDVTWTLHVDIDVLLTNQETLDSLSLSLLVYKMWLIASALKCWVKINSIILYIEHLSDSKCLNITYLNPTLRTIQQSGYHYHHHFKDFLRHRDGKQLVQGTHLSPLVSYKKLIHSHGFQYHP